MRPIFLIGYMGSGKTTLGKAVTQATSTRFVDLDEAIEARERMSVSEIFRRQGEQGFRDIERAVLRDIAASGEDTVVACGGGTPCFADNMDIMLRSGTVVFLDASVRRLCERLSEGRAKRPLIAALDDEELRDFIGRNLAARLPAYSRAPHRFDADRLDTREQLDDSVGLFINRFMK